MYRIFKRSREKFNQCLERRILTLYTVTQSKSQTTRKEKQQISEMAEKGLKAGPMFHGGSALAAGTRLLP